MKRSTLIAVILLLLLGGLAYFINQQPSPSEEETSTPAAPTSFMLINLAETEVQGIHFETSENKAVIGRDADGLWRLDIPKNESIDLAGLEVQVTNLLNLKVTQTIEADLKDQDVGLDHPTLNVSITMNGGSSHQVQIGSMNPFGNSYYARKDGGAIVLVNSITVENILGFVNSINATPTPASDDGDNSENQQTTLTPSVILSE